MQLDNPNSNLSVNDRLMQLTTKDSRWEQLSLNFSKSVNVPFPTSGIYDLTGGIYLLGDSSRKGLYYTYLPNKPDEEVQWKVVRTDQTILDMGLCVYEHDLLAIITTWV